MRKIRVVIVDDSALIREMFSEILASDPNIEVAGVAHDPFDAREKIKALNPDVITLDIEMPKMDGISFLEKIMSLRPMPVVMVSSLTQKGAEATFEALEKGAVDFISKTSSRSFDAEVLSNELVEKVKAAARAKIKKLPQWGMFGKTRPLNSSPYRENLIIAMGASTGGVEALREVISPLPKDCPPVIITQHMPETFTATFASRLDSISNVRVHEAIDNQPLERGNAYIAPGGKHLKIIRMRNKYVCRLDDGEKVSGHKPSADFMFNSVAKVAGQNAIGVIMTGMGKDGAVGMLSMKKAGAYNIGQDETSCVVYGMPKAAYLAGAIDKQVPLEKIATEILQNSI